MFKLALAMLAGTVAACAAQPVHPLQAGPDIDPVNFPADLDVEHINEGGKTLDLRGHIHSDKVTVFDFYAEWCVPCRKVDAVMLHRLRQDPPVALRKIDIVDWDSPVARQYLRNVKGLPYVLVYSPAGDEIDRIAGLDLNRLLAATNTGVAP